MHDFKNQSDKNENASYPKNQIKLSKEILEWLLQVEEQPPLAVA